MHLQLRYGEVLVGTITDALEHQGTWLGKFESLMCANRTETERRIGEFIALCKEWHGRVDSGEGPDASEFDAFRDLLTSGQWHVAAPNGAAARIEEAPVFVEGEISWICQTRDAPWDDFGPPVGKAS